MVKIPPFCTEGTGSVPGQGTKICYAAGKKKGGGVLHKGLSWIFFLKDPSNFSLLKKPESINHLGCLIIVKQLLPSYVTVCFSRVCYF